MGKITREKIKRFPLKNSEQLRLLLTWATNRLLQGRLSKEDCRAVGFMCNCILEILKFQKENEIEKRLAALEALLDSDREVEDL